MEAAVRQRRAAPAPKARRAPALASGDSGSAATREALILAAMTLFADRAIGAVPLREIVQKAGQGNQSAIQYHFKDKQGLVAAVAESVHALFAPYFADALADIERREREGRLTDEDLVGALVMPLILLFHGNERGRDAIRFVARLTSDGGDLGQSLVLRQSAHFLTAIESRFAARQPGKRRELLQLQILLALSSTIFGLTAIGGLRHSPFGESTTLYAGRFDDLIRDYVRFVGRGMLEP